MYLVLSVLGRLDFMIPFLEASGASGPLLLSVGAPGLIEQETRAFDLPFALVGRDPRSDLHLDHPEVSDRHACFQLIAGQLVCLDLGSRNGVYHGGRRRRISDVEREQAVRIGPYRIRLLSGDAPARGGENEAEDSPAVFELAHRSIRRASAALPKGLSLIGSAPDCGVRLIDPSVSNYHCSVLRSAQGVWIVDLLGAGGLRVNGHEISYARLYDGDEVQVGQSTIRLSTRAEASLGLVETPPKLSVSVPTPDSEPASPALVTLAVKPERIESDDALQVAHAADLVDRIVAPLVQQFGALQQQMVEEMNQARALMFDTFAMMHQEQSSFLNHELEQLRALSQELQTLRADLERETRRVAAQATLVPVGGSPVVALSPAVLNGNHHRVVPPAHAAPREIVPEARASRSTLEATATADKVHAALCDRISLIQREQQSRWQTILSILPGASQSRASL